MVRIARNGLVVAIVAVLIFCGTAVAKKYTVKKSDTLWEIAQAEYGKGYLWKIIAEINNIADPRKLRAGLTIIIPDIRYAPMNYSNPGADKYIGTLDRALILLKYPKEARRLLRNRVKKRDFADSRISYGDKFAMVFGKNIVRFNVTASWNDPQRNLLAEKYSVISSGVEYTLKYVIWCGNWCRYPDKEISAPKRITKSGIARSHFVYIPPEKRKLALEHEPIVGAYAWKNNLARGWGGYGEYMAWLRKTSLSGYANGWSPGIGIYGFYSEGDSLKSSYHWLEKGIGPQVGIKYIANGEKPWQWQGKLRFVWEEMKGSNSEGYNMEQNNLKFGFYTEYARKESKKWIWGATGEAWFAFNRDIDSTWSGDRPSKRMTLASYIFAQRKLSDNWQLRGAGGVFYQGWDRLTGLRAQLEARYKETLMFGPWVSFFPFGLTSVYDGYSASDLTTVGGFVRVELGGIFREWDRNVRMSRIRKADKEWLDSL
ncbi:LysM peptidoglycan-binding domain-containing protein [bacterium]|nr:LysM peptidoglycan-binding domain-containing protein [bacterium]